MSSQRRNCSIKKLGHATLKPRRGFCATLLQESTCFSSRAEFESDFGAEPPMDSKLLRDFRPRKLDSFQEMFAKIPFLSFLDQLCDSHNADATPDRCTGHWASMKQLTPPRAGEFHSTCQGFWKTIEREDGRAASVHLARERAAL